jgi:hypothetical protein
MNSIQKQNIISYQAIVVFILLIFTFTGINIQAQTTDSTRQVAMDTWFAYVPPSGAESNLLPFDQWVEIYEWRSLEDDPPQPGNPMEFSTNDVLNDFTSELYLYIFTMALLSDGKNLSSFQLNHLVFYNSATLEYSRAKWGWK